MALQPSNPPGSLLDRYRAVRARSRQLFNLLTDEAYYAQPIDLRHPIVFYDGHLPGFAFNTLIKKALGGASIDPELELLFARGIDPASTDSLQDGNDQLPAPPGAVPSRSARWPPRPEVRAFCDEADARIVDALANETLDRPGHPLLDRAEAAFAIIEHEAMHQETLLYMWHRLPFDQKLAPPGYAPIVAGRTPALEWIEVPAGRATLGVDRGSRPFGWDNEFPSYQVDVARFEIARHDVTNGQFLEFLEADGYRDPRWWQPDDWRWVQERHVAAPLFWERETGAPGRPVSEGWTWRTMFGRVPLPESWPVYVTQAEASAFARWRGARLATEAEYQRAAFGSAAGEREHPWGSAPPTSDRGVFDFSSWDPEPAGTHPAGASAWGIEDLVGNGWEWTSTPFAPFPGFRPMASYPEYSADFFDGEHYVLKGGSPVTSRLLLRPSFRNWFRRRYPYMYATFRCVKGRA